MALRRFWYVRGHLAEGRRWLQAALTSCPSAAPLSRAAALEGMGHIAVKQGDIAAAGSCYAQALALARTPADTAVTAAATEGLAVVAMWTGAHEWANRLSRESIALWRRTGDASGLASALNIAGLVEIQRGWQRDAAVLLEEGLAVSQAVGDEGLMAALGEQWMAADCLDGLARVSLGLGRPPRAARLWGAADALCGLIGATTLPLDPAVYERLVGRARAAMGEEAFAEARAQGAALTFDQVLAEALEDAEQRPPADRGPPAGRSVTPRCGSARPAALAGPPRRSACWAPSPCVAALSWSTWAAASGVPSWPVSSWPAGTSRPWIAWSRPCGVSKPPPPSAVLCTA